MRKKTETRRAVRANIHSVDAVQLYISLRAPGTQRNLNQLWHLWRQFLEQPFIHADPEHASQEHAIHFYLCRQARVCPATLRGNMAALQGIYAFLQARGEVPMNIFAEPYQRIKNARAGDIRPSMPVSGEDVAALLDAPDPFTPEGKRDRCWLALMFCGFRLGEVRAFALRDYCTTRQGNGYMVVRKAKVGHRQDRAIPSWCAGRVLAVIALRRAEGAGDLDPLLVKHGRALSASWFQHAIKRWAARAGITGTITPHYGRCSCVCQLLDAGASYRAISDITGHGVQMVAYYDRRRTQIDQSVAEKLDYERSKSEQIAHNNISESPMSEIIKRSCEGRGAGVFTEMAIGIDAKCAAILYEGSKF